LKANKVLTASYNSGCRTHYCIGLTDHSFLTSWIF